MYRPTVALLSRLTPNRIPAAKDVTVLFVFFDFMSYVWSDAISTDDTLTILLINGSCVTNKSAKTKVADSKCDCKVSKMQIFWQ